MKLTKRKKLMLDTLAKNISTDVERFYEQWETALPYRTMMIRFLRTARSLGLTIQELALLLESQNAFRIAYDLTGHRYIFPHRLSEETINGKIQDAEHEREQIKQLKRKRKNAPE